MRKLYAGIGSRETPPEILPILTAIAVALRKRGWILRSGGASGADQAFESGAGDAKEIFLPWRHFEGNESLLFTPSVKAFEMAAKYHPAWNRCGSAARRFHARNCHQVLGAHLDEPVQMIVCWTKAGLVGGGTGQALRIAEDLKIPVVNLG